MTDADNAVRTAAADIPADMQARFKTSDSLSDDDRKAIIEIASKSLERFQPKPASEGK